MRWPIGAIVAGLLVRIAAQGEQEEDTALFFGAVGALASSVVWSRWAPRTGAYALHLGLRASR